MFVYVLSLQYNKNTNTMSTTATDQSTELKARLIDSIMTHAELAAEKADRLEEHKANKVSIFFKLAFKDISELKAIANKLHIAY